MTIENKKHALIQAAYYGMIAAGIYLFLRHLLSPLGPFLCGFLFAWILHKPARRIGEKLHVHTRYPAFLLSIVFYAIVFTCALIAGVQVISAMQHFVPQIPVIYASRIVPFISENLDKLEIWAKQFDPAIVDVIDRLTSEFFSYMEKAISSLSVAAVRLVSSIITGMPSAILSIILTVVSTFFISMDFESIVGYVRNLLPTRIQKTISSTVTTGVDSVRKILVSYILIMLLSFVELSVGFLILKIPYAMGLALLVAVIDIMPVLGTGLVLIPWAIIAAILRNFPMAIGVALLYIIMLVVRNVVEPKLVGKQMGLHPIATLVSMFLGLHMFGIAGLFGFPIALSLFIKLRKSRQRAVQQSA